jgi:hypothetical protein
VTPSFHIGNTVNYFLMKSSIAEASLFTPSIMLSSSINE